MEELVEKQTEFATPSSPINLSEHLPYLLASTSNLVSSITGTSYLDEIENAPKLNLREIRVIMQVANTGPSSPAGLAELTGMDRSTITRAAASLQERGFVNVLKNARDGRGKYISLSAKGAELCDNLIPLMKIRGDQIAQALSQEEFETLIGLLSKVRKHVDKIKPTIL